MTLPRFLVTSAVGSTPEEFRAKIASDMEKYSKLVKAAGIKPD
jgi:tripartite-type tricarboxylate transporter receptor subunit TctC